LPVRQDLRAEPGGEQAIGVAVYGITQHHRGLEYPDAAVESRWLGIVDGRFHLLYLSPIPVRIEPASGRTRFGDDVLPLCGHSPHGPTCEEPHYADHNNPGEHHDR
jgi:hypothetical protein